MALTFVRTGELIHAQWSEFDNHSRMTAHGFRGIASTVLHEHGYPHEHIALQLAHQARAHDGRVYTGATPATHDVTNPRVVEASLPTGLCGRANRYGPCGPVPFSAAGRHDGPAALSPQRPERRMAEAAALPARFVL